MRVKTAVQLYTLRALDEPLVRTLDRVADAGFDGVEFAGLGEASTADVAAALDRLDLGTAGAHVGVEELRADPADAAATYREVGATTLVVPYLDGSHFADADAVDATAADLDDLASSLSAHDARLAYHNHEQEFVDLGEETAYDRLLAASRVDVELDVGWARAAGRDPATLLDRYGDRVAAVHLKDVVLDESAPRGGRPVDLGDGDVDLAAAVEAARAADVEWVVFEHDDPPDADASLQRAAETFDTLLG